MVRVYVPAPSPSMRYTPSASVDRPATASAAPSGNTWTAAPTSGWPVSASVTVPETEPWAAAPAASTSASTTVGADRIRRGTMTGAASGRAELNLSSVLNIAFTDRPCQWKRSRLCPSASAPQRPSAGADPAVWASSSAAISRNCSREIG